MNKKIINIFIISFFCASLFALDTFHIDINVEFGSANGEINEYVFYSPISDSEYMLSRLDWDLDFIKYAGASADIVLFEHFYLGLAGRLGLPGRSGYMQDYDWMNSCIDGYNSKWYDEHYWLTHYSKHNNKLTKYLDGTAKIGGIVNLPYQIFLLPSFSVQGQEFAFDGLNGYLKHAKYNSKESCYEEWSDDISSESPAHWKPITYDQQRIFFFLGLKIYTTILPKFRFDFEVNYSPYALIGALDTHYSNETKGTEYLDQPRGAGTWKITGQIQFAFSKHGKVGLNLDYQYMPVLKGKDYSRTLNGKKWELSPGCQGGASSHIFSYSLSASLYF